MDILSSFNLDKQATNIVKAALAEVPILDALINGKPVDVIVTIQLKVKD